MLLAGRMVPAPAHTALAEDGTDTATQTTALSISESTAVVTDSSGYHVTVSISQSHVCRDVTGPGDRGLQPVIYVRIAH